MNKIIVILAVLISVISMSAPENEARKILDNQERQLEQERLRIEQKQKQSEFENTQFDKGSNVEDCQRKTNQESLTSTRI